jgi:hypothetical protein
MLDMGDQMIKVNAQLRQEVADLRSQVEQQGQTTTTSSRNGSINGSNTRKYNTKNPNYFYPVYFIQEVHINDDQIPVPLP